MIQEPAACGEALYPADGLSELTRQAVAMARRQPHSGE